MVERPERLRAVAVGIAAACARLEEYEQTPLPSTSLAQVKLEETKGKDASESLVDALNQLSISAASEERATATTAFNILNASYASPDILNHDAIRFIHGEAPEYLAKLNEWASLSESKIRTGESEIPTGYSQGDLYRTCASIPNPTTPVLLYVCTHE